MALRGKCFGFVRVYLSYMTYTVFFVRTFHIIRKLTNLKKINWFEKKNLTQQCGLLMSAQTYVTSHYFHVFPKAPKITWCLLDAFLFVIEKKIDMPSFFSCGSSYIYFILNNHIKVWNLIWYFSKEIKKNNKQQNKKKLYNTV